MEPTQNHAKQNEELLLRCCELRRQLYHKLQKSLDEGTDVYRDEMKKLHQEIDEIMKKL